MTQGPGTSGLRQEMISLNINGKRQSIKGWVNQQPFLRYRPVIMMSRVISEMVTRDANHLAAGVAYFAIFGVFPFVLGAIVISGLLLDSEVVQQRFLEFLIGNLPGSDPFIKNNITGLVEQRSTLAVISIIGVLWSSSSVFSAINRVVNRAWNIYRTQPFHISRVKHLSALFVFGLFFFASVAISSTLQILGEQDLGFPGVPVFLDPSVVSLLIAISSWCLATTGFLLIYRFLPNCRVYWRHVWLGALVAGTLFEVSKELFAWYLPNYVNTQQLYGSIASAIVFLFWVYLSAMILTLGAEICAQYRKIYHPGDVEEEDLHVWSSY